MAKKTKLKHLEINEFEPIFNTINEVESGMIPDAPSTDSDNEEIVINYDGLWKLIMEAFFWDCMEFFLPDLFAKLDLKVAPEFLDQELLMIQKELNIPKQITDKLIKVRLLDGTEQWILIHVEVQTKFEINFSTRMYLYQAFIYAKYRLPIVALAVFTTAHTPKYFNVYKAEYFGTKSYYHYNAYKIAKQDEAALIASPNIFALFVLAHLYVIKTTPKKYEDRVLFKEKLFALAEEKQIPKDKITRMLIFVDEIIALPLKFQISFMKTRNIQSRSESELAAMAALERSTIALAPSLFRAFAAREGMTYEAYVALEVQKAEALIIQAEVATKNAEVEKKNVEVEKKNVEVEKKNVEVEKKNVEALIIKAEVEKKNVEVEKKNVEAEKKNVEALIIRMEAEKKNVEAEKKKVEAEKKQAEIEKIHQRIFSVIGLYEQANFDALKIALIQQLAVAEVEYILQMHQQKLSVEEMTPLLKTYQQQIAKKLDI